MNTGKSVDIVNFGVQSGVGVIRTHQVVDQVHAFPQVITPVMPVGHTKVDGTFRRRFGNVAVKYNSEFNYPTGAPGVYAQSRPGYEGYGNKGDGAYNAGGHDSEFHPASDLLEAQGIVNRSVTFAESMSKRPAVYGDMIRHDIREKIEDINLEFHEKRIRGLYEKGFSEGEITHLIEKEREKAIEKADKIVAMPKAEDVVREMMGAGKDVVAPPGGVPAKKDLSAYERSTGIGGAVARTKKYQALNREIRMRREIEEVEAPRVEREQVDILDLVKRIGAQRGSETEKREALNEHVREEQKEIAAVKKGEEEGMRRAMEAMPLAGAGETFEQRTTREMGLIGRVPAYAPELMGTPGEVEALRALFRAGKETRRQEKRQEKELREMERLEDLMKKKD